MTKRKVLVFLVATCVSIGMCRNTARCQRAETGQSMPGESQGPRCCVVANYDMNSGRPYVTFISNTKEPYPVVFEIADVNDSSVHVSLFLPYTSPSRFPDPTWIDMKSGCCHLFVDHNGDTAHFLIKCLEDSGTVTISAIKDRHFIDVVPVSEFPGDMIIFQMKDNSESLCRELCRLLKGKAHENVLEAGFYRGISSLVCVDQLGIKYRNRTACGRLLAVELDEPLDDQTYFEMKSFAEQNELVWFATSTGSD